MKILCADRFRYFELSKLTFMETFDVESMKVSNNLLQMKRNLWHDVMRTLKTSSEPVQ
jgi:hypothetical protein